MTSGRFWLITLSLSGTALALGCGEAGSACTECPPLEGRYALEFAPGTVPEACASLGVGLPEGPLELQRAGSQLTGSVEDVSLQGTVYSNGTFSVLGTRVVEGGGGSDSLGFNGRYTPASTDGGTAAQLSGTYTGGTTRGSGQGAPPCSLVRSFTATRQ